MKRRVALLMAAVLILGTGFSAYATEPGASAEAGQESTAQGDIGTGNTDSPERAVGTTGSGAANESGEAGGQEVQPGDQSVQDGQAAEGIIGDGGETGSLGDSGNEGGDGSRAGTENQPGDGAQAGNENEPGDGTEAQPGDMPQPGDEIQPGDGSQAGTENQPGDALQTGSGNQTGDVPGTGEEGQVPEDPQTEAGQKITNPGQVDVSIGAALVLENPVTFHISLSNRDGADYEDFIELHGDDGEHSDEGIARFRNLAPGSYALRVSAQGFATYTQEISVKGRESVNLMTGFLGGMDYVRGAAHPGVLLIGDVNGDGLINEGDRAALMEAIEGGGIDANPRADLNGDGQVDLVDLEYLTKGYQKERDILAKIQSSVPPAAMTLELGSGRLVEGDLEELLQNDRPVTLQPAGDGPISKDNPVVIEFQIADVGEAGYADGIVVEMGATPVQSATATIEYADLGGTEGSIERTIPMEEGIHFLLESGEVKAEVDEKGNIQIHLGSQVVIKRVTLTITGMKDDLNLAEISKVEFVNGMEERIPEPEMNVPSGFDATAGSKRISMQWETCVNITGYEVEITHVSSGLSERVMVPKNALDITSFGGKELVNYQEYQVRVQSVNGTWRSGYGESKTVTPKPNGKPDKPDNVSATGKYQSIQVSWKSMKDTLSYNLYYKKSSESEYQKIEGITGNSYTITGLSDSTEYTVYVTAVNEFGESGPSLSAAATTSDLYPAVMPKYGLINTGEKGQAGAHIVSASMNGTMEGSPLDVQAGTAWGTVDKDASSYYRRNTWDDGGFNTMKQSHGLVYEFDQAYKMDTIAFHDATSQDTGIFYAQVQCWDEAGNATYYTYGRISLQSKRDAAGKVYYQIKLPEPVNVKKIQFGLARYAAQGNQITVSEVYFYHYDTLTEDIMNLYEDDLHTVLRPDVTMADIEALRARVNTVDAWSGEYHPNREVLELELQTAEAILKDTGLRASVEVHSGITTKDENRGFGGLNAWQPLGVAAAAQEEIVVYVGHSSKKTGETADLQLVATQYHSEAAQVSQVVGTLKVGANQITVPKLGSTTGIESGGALYVQYTGNGGAADRYAVRVSGGVQVPKLDLYQVTDEAERLRRATAYVEALDTYVGRMAAEHEQLHVNGSNSQVNYAYDERNCILGATDILLDTMMLSLPAQQVLSGTGSGSATERAGRLLISMNAVEDEMYLFYQHKGLNAAAPQVKDQIPRGHLNIRYQRMFSGAFMYASGNHIGIEWGSAPGLMSSVGVQASADGRYQSGGYFGWGVAHEIGHCINQGSYAVAEITNNYYSVLAQAKDNNGSVRFQYGEVYKKVTSNAKGAASNVFTQLGMYWQLHLAYDRGYNYRTYEDYDEQLAGLFFARVDTYARSTEKAPSPGGVALKLAGDKDQNLMRLSCAAAEKNILEFFERWGMTPNEETRAYAGQFEKETRAIYYVCDDSRAYTLQGGTSALGNTGTVEAVGDAVTAVINPGDANQVDITLSSKTIPEGDVLGYEIVRCMLSGGRTVREAAGFTTESTFSDRVYSNNRVVWYEITVIDKYLNRSAVKTLEPVKVENDGSLDKSSWTVRTEGLQEQDTTVIPGSEEDPCAPEPENLAKRLIDNDINTVYTATAGGTAEIVMEFNKTLTVAGFKYQVGDGTAGNYTVQVLCDGIWVEAASGSFTGTRTGTIHFANPDGKYVSTYSATALKVVLSGQSGTISIAELDVLGVTGDNVDFRRAQDGTAAIGRLAEDYRYGQGASDVIPAGAIVFMGSYKGNPAYNAVVLYDQDGDIVGGVDEAGNLKAQYVILADVPPQGDIQNVSDGTWIYWIADGKQEALIGVSKVRAELYRVNDALTNEGQRLVSDSLFEAVPANLPEIRIDGGSIPQQ